MDPAVSNRLRALLPALRPGRRQPQQLSAASPRLSVVVVNYLHWQDTAALVRQLRATPAVRHGAAEVVVVDNDSPWHPLVRRLRQLEGVSLRRWQHNHGFARAVNEGCRLSRGSWILLLNPDMTLEPGFLDKALARATQMAREQPRAGIVGFRLANSDGRAQLSAGPFPTLLGTLARLVLPRARRKYYLREQRSCRPVDWVTGCCLLVQRRCWEEVGGLDPSFFLYYEDVDLCRRAREHGWSVWYEPALWAVHHHPLHARAVPPALRLVTRHALLTYAHKHWPGWQFRLLSRLVGLEARVHERRARRRGDPKRAGLFEQLGHLAGEMCAGRLELARRRLLRVVTRQEEWRAAASVHRHPQP